jgi:hypothetical protein
MLHILENLKTNNIEAGATPYGHYYAIRERSPSNPSLCYTLYDKQGIEIPCFTRSEQKRYPKKSATFANNEVKKLNKLKTLEA